MPATKLQPPTKRKRADYPMGSISSGTMRNKDLIPTFASELESLARQSGIVPAKTRKEHKALIAGIERSQASAPNEVYFDSEQASDDLEQLFDALGEYSGPYFYFGAHPGDGADYGFWLSEDWDEDFIDVRTMRTVESADELYDHLKVSDTSEVPSKFRGEVAHVSDHGNVTLYVATSRGLREIWSVV